MAKIYVSSTFSDLQEYREGVRAVLPRLGYTNVAMEDYTAADERPVDRCLRDVAGCDLYLGIFAWRYGYIPPGYDRSITELEYRQAVAAGKECLIFLLDDDAPWPRTKMEMPAMEQLETLRAELRERHQVAVFSSVSDLQARVSEAVSAWEKRSGLAGPGRGTDWEAYRRAVYEKHRWVRLQVIAGASRYQGIAQIPLQDVFTPQLAEARAPSFEVPEEVTQYHGRIYRPDELAAAETGEGPAGGEAAEETGEAAEETEAASILIGASADSILDILGRERTQVILGGPGLGKSTIFQYALVALCSPDAAPEALPRQLRHAPLPFLIELRQYVFDKQAPDFITYLVNNAATLYQVAIDPASLAALFDREGQTVIFFDGLDEIFDRQERRRVLQQFDTFARSHPQVQLVVTSRIAGYDKTELGTAGFSHYTLLPFNLQQIRRFVLAWYRYYTLEGTERDAQGLIQRIADSPRLLDLGGTPLLLTMMAIIYKDRDLPTERWILYQRCSEVLLEEWELKAKDRDYADFKLAVHIRIPQKTQILQRVARYMLEHGQPNRELNAIAYEPLLDILVAYLREKHGQLEGEAGGIAVEILEHLRKRTYVLAEIGDRRYGFVHRTFMEYFAAGYWQYEFNRRKSNDTWLKREVFYKHWRQDHWQEVLFLLIAMLHDQGTPIRDIVEYLRVECRQAPPTQLAFAARCLAEAGGIEDPAQAQSLLLELARAIAAAAGSRTKRDIAFTENGLKAFTLLVPLIPAPPKLARVVAPLQEAKVLAKRIAGWQMSFALRSRSEKLKFALAALQDREAAVRRGAIAALEREWPGKAAVVQPLAAVAGQDRDRQVRQAALSALQRFWSREPAVLEAIEGWLARKPVETHLTRTVEYLAATWPGDPRALALLMKLSGSLAAYSEALTVAVAQAIAQGWRLHPGLLDRLQDQALREPDARVRQVAIWAIARGWPGAPETLAWLQERAVQDPDDRVIAAAIKAIAEGWRDDLPTQAWLWERAVQAQAPEIRETAIGELAEGALKSPDRHAWLLERTGQAQDPEVRLAVVQALIRQGGSFEGPWLREQVAREPDPQVRAAMIQEIVQAWWWGYDPEMLVWLRQRAAQEQDPRLLVAVNHAIERHAWMYAGLLPGRPGEGPFNDPGTADPV